MKKLLYFTFFLFCTPETNLQSGIPDTNLQNQDCAICLSTIIKGDNIDLRCSKGSNDESSPNPHIYHVECIAPWIQKNKENPLCPTCRTRIDNSLLSEIVEKSSHQNEQKAPAKHSKNNTFARFLRFITCQPNIHNHTD